MDVFVIGQNGTRLMPCTPRKARLLLKNNKAKVYCSRPYTIQLLYKTGSTMQHTSLGIDTGSQHIGVGITNEQKVLYKAEIELRSTMEKRALLETRKAYRKGRRYRNTGYRKPKFKFHTKRIYSEALVQRKSTKHMTHWTKLSNSMGTSRPEGWLPPSIQSKVDHHVAWIQRYLDVLPKQTKLHIEVGRFDIARIKNPEIHKEQYQTGPMYDFENINAFVFDNDHYTCKVCHKKAGTKRTDGSIVKLRAHHIDFRKNGATDNPERMCSVCDYCHTDAAHKPGGILYQWMLEGKKFSRGYRDATMMNIIRKRLFTNFPDAEFTYGNITKVDRKSLNLPKSHANDAVAIASHGQKTIKDIDYTVMYRQFRKKKRSLHEATPRKGRKEPNRLAVRNSKNTKRVGSFWIGDKVAIGKTIGWITGFSGKSSAYVKDSNNKYVTMPGKTYKQVLLPQLKLKKHNNGWLCYAV